MTDSASITFKTNLAAPYALAEESTGPYIIPVDMDRTELSTFLAELLETDKQFDFRVNNGLLRGTIRNYLQTTEEGTELNLEVEYFLLWDVQEPECVDKTPSPIIDMLKITRGSENRVVALCSAGQIVSYPMSSPDCEIAKDEAIYTSVLSEEPLCFLMQIVQRDFGRIRVATASGLIFEFDGFNLEKQPTLVHRVLINKAISAAAINSDGTKYAFGTADGAVHISTQREILVSTVSAVCFLLISRDQTSSKKRKKPTTDQDINLVIAHSFPDAHTGVVTTLSFCERGREFYLISGGHDAKLRILDHIEGTNVHGFNASEAITTMQINNAGDKLTAITGHFDGRVRVWEICMRETEACMTLLKSFSSHSRSVLRCAYNLYEDCQNIVLSTGNDQVVSVIDISANTIPLTMQIVQSGIAVQRPEYPALPSAALWIEKRTALVGTTHNDLLKYKFD